MHRVALCLATAAAFFALPASAGPYGDQTIVLKLRTDVTLTYYFTDTHPRRGAVVLFVGGAGVLATVPENFLLRVWKRFLEAGYAVAIPDVPTDHPQGLLGNYRSSFDHAAGDIRGIVYDVQSRTGHARTWLIGTSRGSISAASGGAWLSPIIAGIVLTSTVTRPDADQEYGTGTVFGVPLGSIKVPVFLLGHAQDVCPISPPADMQNIEQKLSHAPHKTSALVLGGLQAPLDNSKPCEAKSPHGFWNSGFEAVDRIVHFMENPGAN